MNLIELLPKESNDWFSAIFEIAKSEIIEDKISVEDKKYVSSHFYETTMLTISHYYKPIIILNEKRNNQ
jgi:hypothetical protein